MHRFLRWSVFFALPLVHRFICLSASLSCRHNIWCTLASSKFKSFSLHKRKERAAEREKMLNLLSPAHTSSCICLRCLHETTTNLPNTSGKKKEKENCSKFDTGHCVNYFLSANLLSRSSRIDRWLFTFFSFFSSNFTASGQGHNFSLCLLIYNAAIE